jgi:hypothetical protein
MTPDLVSSVQGNPLEVLEKSALLEIAQRAKMRKAFKPRWIQLPAEIWCSIRPATWSIVPSDLGPRLRQEILSSVIRPEGRPYDPWKVRDDFLRLKRGDLEGLIAFLGHYGEFSTDAPESPDDCWREWDDVRGILLNKTSYRDFLRDQSDHLFNHAHALAFRWLTMERNEGARRKGKKNTVPCATIHASSVLGALQLTVDIDLARRVKYRECARKDCEALYAVTSRHKRRFCTQYCAHLASKRRTAKKCSTPGK